jgi:hypothetical protein
MIRMRNTSGAFRFGFRGIVDLTEAPLLVFDSSYPIMLVYEPQSHSSALTL